MNEASGGAGVQTNNLRITRRPGHRPEQHLTPTSLLTLLDVESLLVLSQTLVFL